MEIKNSYYIFQEVHSGNKKYKDKEWIAVDELVKGLNIMIEDTSGENYTKESFGNIVLALELLIEQLTDKQDKTKE